MSSPAGSQASYDLEGEPTGGEANSDSGAESDGDDGKSDFSRGQRAQSLESDLEGNERRVSGFNAASGSDGPSGMDDSDVERDIQLLSHQNTGSEKPLDADDAVSEKILTTSIAVCAFIYVLLFYS